MTARTPKARLCLQRSALAIGAIAISMASSACARRAAEVRNTNADLVSPVVMGGDNGLELRWWIVADESGDALASTLGAYAHLPVPLEPAVQQRWRDNGLRLIKTPIEDLASIKSALPVVGRVDRHWLGQTPRWTELLQGEPIGSHARVIRNGALSGLSEGRMRLLGRAWTSPAPGGAHLRADLALQHLPPDDLRKGAADPLGLAERLPPDARGLVLTDLTANAALEPGYAYIIVPENPSRTWLAGGSVAPTALFDWGELAGPPAPPTPTIGQALLTGAPLHDGRADLRAVVILIPRTPTEFNLLAGPRIARTN